MKRKSVLSQLTRCLTITKQKLRHLVKPTNYSLPANVLADLTRSKSELILENAFLRQQLIILDRQVKRPQSRPHERVLLVALASRLKAWKQALLIVQPDTMIRWHRDLFKWLWKRKSKPSNRGGRSPLLKELVDLIQRMARENRTWGAERIRGGTAEARYSGGKEYHPEVHPTGSQTGCA
jgi:putative transposase